MAGNVNKIYVKSKRIFCPEVCYEICPRRVTDLICNRKKGKREAELKKMCYVVTGCNRSSETAKTVGISKDSYIIILYLLHCYIKLYRVIKERIRGVQYLSNPLNRLIVYTL